MIRVENLVKTFGGVRAVDDASLSIETGRITGLIGPNGAGKTTLFNCIAGDYRPEAGRILLQTEEGGEEEIAGLKPHELFAKGVLRTFQIAHEFHSLTVRENLMAVPGGQEGESLLNAWFRPAAVRAQEEAIRARADDVIDFLEIAHVADERAGNLSGGQKKLLELGRCMMTDARVVFLDEVGAGVNRTLLNTIGDAIHRLRDERGYTFCMIEHDMRFISRMCDHVVVMAEGAVLCEGSAEQVQSDERVIEAYLGGGLKKRPGRGAAPEGATAPPASPHRGDDPDDVEGEHRREEGEA